MVLKTEVFLAQTSGTEEYGCKSYEDLRQRVLRDVYKSDIDARDIISVIEKTWEDEVRPVMSNSRTWFKRKNFALRIYYRADE